MRLIESYLHGKNLGIPASIGVLVDIEADTEDKSHRENLRELAYEIAMQIAATNPTHIGDRLIHDHEETDEEESPDLLIQPYIKDPEKIIREIIYDCEQKIGAPIQIKRFIRYAVSDT
jgi:elongation factor Ts